jgi:cell division protein FtsA
MKPIVEVGLDIGSSQVAVAIGKTDAENGATTVLGAGRAPCKGLKGGVVVNIAESKLAIARAVEDAETMAKETVENMIVGIRGSHIETFNHRGAINISRTDKEINAEDVENVITNSKAIQLSSDREILHTVPQDFSVDKQNGVEDPVGMEGSHLAVDVHISVASSNHISNIVKAINLSGFTCEDLIYGILAVGDSVVSDEQKDLGVALLDLGGQTSNLAIYTDGSLKFSKELPFGGELITKDISYGLKTSFTIAQNLKEKYGLAMASLLPQDEMIEFPGVEGRSPRQLSRKNLVEIIQSRLEEVFELILQELQKSNYLEYIPGGLVLTGGSSKLSGIEQAAEKFFGMNIQMGHPMEVQGPVEIVTDPSYATAIGLLKYRHAGEWSKSRRSFSNGSSLISKVRGWLDEVF